LSEEGSPFTVEAIPGFNVTIWPKRDRDGKALYATRVMVAALDPAHPVNGTVMRRVSVARLLEEHEHPPDDKPWFDVSPIHDDVSRMLDDHSSWMHGERPEGSAEEDRGAGDADDQPQDQTPGPEGGGQSQESEGEA
jgi:hypothetical protein